MIIWLAAAWMLGSPVKSFAQTSVLTPAQTLNRRAISDLEFSPNGLQLVFTLAEAPKGTTRERNLWLLDVPTGELRQLTTAGRGGYGARWSPDGRSIAFLSDRDGLREHLYLLSMSGGEARQLVDRKERVAAFRWSPSGRQIALLMAEPKSSELEKRERDKDDGRVVDKGDRRERVWLLDVEAASSEAALRQVTNGRWHIGQIEWAPTGDRLIAEATDRPESDQWTERIYSIVLANGQFTEVSSPRGPFTGLKVSPDGQTIAYVGSRVDGPEAHDVFLLPTAGGAAQNITSTSLDRPVAQLRWIDDRTMAGTVARGFSSAIVSIARDGRAHTIEGIDVNPGVFARAADGTIAYVGESTTAAPELWLKTPPAPARKITSFNQHWASITVAARETIKYKSFDGTEIEATLLKPSAVKPGPLPTVVLVHGGPTGRWTDTFEPWGQLLVSRGYAVLYPNIRGSTGYGQRFVEMNRGDWGGGDFKDVMAGVDALIARGVADSNRLGIGGWSYGGYMAAWAVTQTIRFKAAVSGAPVIDMASEFGTERGSAYDEWFYGTPYEKLDGFIKSSPISYVKNAKTPTLLLQGEEDATDPIGQSQQFYRGLKRYGIDAELVLYPREDHGLREEKHLIDRLNRVVEWFDKHLKAESTKTTESQR
jgi:dipeptidyl aminopeptidase/acylaminoacyl peptidase